MVGKALHALMASNALQELRLGDHDNFSSSAQQCWSRHRPSTAAQKNLKPSTIEVLNFYGHQVRNLLQRRAEVNLGG